MAVFSKYRQFFRNPVGRKGLSLMCLISSHVYNFFLPSLFYVCITIMRLWQRNVLGNYSTFIWLKVSSLPPHTQILNIRFHPDPIYQCPNNLHAWQFHLPSLLYVSRPIVMQGKRNNHDNYCTSWNLRLLQIPETPVSNQLARTTFSVAITYQYQYNNYEAMKEKKT